MKKKTESRGKLLPNEILMIGLEPLSEDKNNVVINFQCTRLLGYSLADVIRRDPVMKGKVEEMVTWLQGTMELSEAIGKETPKRARKRKLN